MELLKVAKKLQKVAKKLQQIATKWQSKGAKTHGGCYEVLSSNTLNLLTGNGVSKALLVPRAGDCIVFPSVQCVRLGVHGRLCIFPVGTFSQLPKRSDARPAQCICTAHGK